MGSIIEESKKARGLGKIFNKDKKKIIVITFILLAIVGGSYAYFGGNKEAESGEVQVREWTVKKVDLQVAIESDGKVVAEDGVELSFSVSGDTLEVDEVFITEGQKVAKGDKIASVKTDDLQYDLNKVYSSYVLALANYNERLAGATEEEIAKSKSSVEQAEISLEQQKISLEKTKISVRNSVETAEKAVKEAKEDLAENEDISVSEDVRDVYDALVDTIKAISISLEDILPESDEIIGVDQEFVNDSFEQNLGAKDTVTKNKAVTSYNQAKDDKEALNDFIVTLSYDSGYFDIDNSILKAETALGSFEDHLYDMQIMLDNSITSAALARSALDAFKTTINSNRSTINTKITSLRNDVDDIEDAKDGLSDYVEGYQDALDDWEDEKIAAEQDIANAESSLRAKELSLENAKINYTELVAPLTNSELASIKSSLTTASINLAKARNDLDKAVITSPIEGEVAMLNYKAGDIILKDDNEPVVTIINNDTLFIEVNIEEADISKIQVGQKAYTTFDALDSLKLDGEISFISLTSKTDNSGIVTYLVRIIINNTSDAQIREGMTAFVDFITAEAKDVLIVPVAAVRNVTGEPSVQTENGEWIPVVTGFTDGKNVEVISGLQSGDKIIY
ncbi:MAG: HlyD family efflux transporter periplasmic adaptor subunit [Patescibacteria group bacterium]|nr:HlyD family efflux transporter periplasmic adaptor subunit [Patescibacteria group bacterium]